MSQITDFEIYDCNTAPTGDSEILLGYGPSGAGKSWFTGTAGERTWYLNIGEGLETLKSPLFKHYHRGPKVCN